MGAVSQVDVIREKTKRIVRYEVGKYQMVVTFTIVGQGKMRIWYRSSGQNVR